MSETGATIRTWREEDRPREKLLTLGARHLSDAELLAILIGSGSRGESAVDLCHRILDRSNGHLRLLGKLGVHDLMKFKGVGEAKAITLVAALELGRRRMPEHLPKLRPVMSSQDAYHQLAPRLSDLIHEEFWILFLNQANKVIGSEQISRGTISGTVVDVRLIMKQAIDRLATAIILAHNHPSGQLRPSEADRTLTRKLVRAGEILDVKVLDHLIISEEGYYSFADEGEV